MRDQRSVDIVQRIIYVVMHRLTTMKSLPVRRNILPSAPIASSYETPVIIISARRIITERNDDRQVGVIRCPIVK